MVFMLRIRNRYLCLMDLILSFIGFAAMIVLVFPLGVFKGHFVGGLSLISATAFVYAIINEIFFVYRTDWVHAGYTDYLRLMASCVVAALTSILLGNWLSTDVFWLKFNIGANFAVSALVCALRFSIRLIYNAAKSYSNNAAKRVLIIGAGRHANLLMHELMENNRLNYNVVGLIDDAADKKNNLVYGTRVLGNRNDILKICKSKDIDEIIFAISDIEQKDKLDILEICSQTGKKVKILPGIAESITGISSIKKIREINIEDLLERDPIVLDNKLIQDSICEKTVLVTGGGGSIGSELCRQILKYAPKKLVIVDIYENTTYELQNELEETFTSMDIEVLIASVRDKERLDEIFKKYRPNIVFHAAAHKHVPLMEGSPAEAIKNNVLGTYNTARCAAENGVERFVMISTDKAVNPTNIMGASKRMCEMIVQTLQKLSKTEFVAVRFGNVLGSHGSVVPRFTKQIKEGGPVTVTHPEITRFFMTIPEAAQLVLQAGTYAKGGEIFVLDMGEPVKIYDLARKMISLAGYKPDIDIEIKFSGLRPGEKLYEELLMDEEGLEKTAHSKIFIGKPIDISIEELESKIEKLKNALDDDNADLKAVMADVVPTYQYGKNMAKKQKIQEETAVC